MDEATQALVDGMAWAVRVNGPRPCPWCADRQGQILPIWDVINGIVDHENGQCTFLFLPIDDPLLDDSVVHTTTVGIDILIILSVDDVPESDVDDSDIDDDFGGGESGGGGSGRSFLAPSAGYSPSGMVGGSSVDTSGNYYYVQISANLAVGKEIKSKVYDLIGVDNILTGILSASQVNRLRMGRDPFDGGRIDGVDDLVNSIVKIYRDNLTVRNRVSYSFNDIQLPSGASRGKLDKFKDVLKKTGSSVFDSPPETAAQKAARLKKQEMIKTAAKLLSEVKGKWQNYYSDKDYNVGRFDYDVYGDKNGKIKLKNGTEIDFRLNSSLLQSDAGFVLITTGSRLYEEKDYQVVKDSIESLARSTYGGIKYIVEGGAKGADTLVLRAALELGIPVHEYAISDSEWKTYISPSGGKAAGSQRNSQMLWDNFGPGVTTKALSFFNGDVSAGTADMTKKLILAGVDGKIVGLDAEKAVAWSATWTPNYANAGKPVTEQVKDLIKIYSSEDLVYDSPMEDESDDDDK